MATISNQVMLDKLWSLDSESDWTSEEAALVDGSYRHLRIYLQQVLGIMRAEIPHVAHCYAAIAGPQCGFFTPIASIGRDIESLPPTPTSGNGTLAAAYLHDGDPIIFIESPASDSRFVGDHSVVEKLLIKLEAHGEFYGFISLDSYEPGTFSGTVRASLRKILPFFQRTISDSIFTARLRLLAGPFESLGRAAVLEALYAQIAKRATQGFACDGSILRLIDVQSGMLNVVAFEGEVDAYFLEDVRPGERIAGKVFDGVDSDWSLGTLDLSQSSSLTGISVTGEDAVRLRENGIKSFLVMKLISETNGRSDTGLLSRKVGTLGIFHRRPHRFSWRDISLFRAFCQRVADTIALYHKNLELEELAETLRLQGLMITRVEIVALLAHDLGHKAFESCQNVHTYIESCKKALNSTTERRSHAHLEDKAELAIGSAERIQQSLEQIRKLYGSSAGFIGERTEFGIEDVVKDVIEIMGGGLARAKVQIRQEFSGNTRLSGYRSILTQVLLNLVINSIDAVRTQKNRRPTTITIHAHEERLGEQRRVIVQFWDEGPGINRHKFQNPQDIFLIGKTSKENGTGTGLPVARNLIGQYFKGTLTLDDAEKARFRISIPA